MTRDAPSATTDAPQSAGNDEKLLVAEGLDVRYGVAQVLWSVSVSVVRGKATCIIGSNE